MHTEHIEIQKATFTIKDKSFTGVAQAVVTKSYALKEWYGRAVMDDPDAPWELMNADAVEIRFENGRHGKILPRSVTAGSPDFEFEGSGPLLTP